ncbi:plant viral-response family protein [Actinidia rufa]|uniref:Plant viral-response family protein n=1 Tax=Actinidia rufa TaxID=165716 RepID=A0A7J0DXY5_9ERIC|nr:plant viral-response family protein [Actinidia rufa]
MAGGQRTQALNKPCVLLIVIAGMERFAFKGVSSNLVTYLTDVVKMSNSSAAKTVNSWCGFTSMLPLLVAPLADSLLGPVFYSFGLCFPLCSWAYSIDINNIGQGGYNPSLQTFGADQLDTDDELPSTKNGYNSDQKSLFFKWWYFGICSGSLMGVSLMSYVQDTLGWGLGFAIPTIMMVTSVALLSCGSRFFTYKQAKGGVPSETSIVHSIKATAAKMMNCGFTTLSSKSDVVELELEERPLCHQDLDVNEGLDNSTSNGIQMLEIAKVVLHLLPIWTMLLVFAIIFQQPATFFTKQGMTMKRNIGSNFKIPPATLQSAITVSIILLMPFYDTFFIPLCRIFTHDEKGISVMQRMGIGMFLSVVAMIIAALYILLGISDIFTVVGMQEFFYGEVPVGMRTMGIALYTSVFGVGSFLSALLISLLEHFTSSRDGKLSWFCDDMRQARLDKYYWLLAFASALSLLIFIVLCRFFRSRS